MSGGSIDLAVDRLGGRVLEANDEFFAPKERLIRAEPPERRSGVSTDVGEWMDGWVTRRRRTPGHDWCVVALGIPGIVETVVIDTAHFNGNHPERVSLDAADVDGDPTDDDWFALVDERPVAGDDRNSFEVTGRGRVTHVRLNIRPDGAVARLRVLGTPLLDWSSIEGPTIDLASAAFGARLVAVSDAQHSRPEQMLYPDRSRGVFDGWETPRRRGPGHDWADIDLAVPGAVRHIVVDTRNFKGSAPGWVRLTGRLLSDGSEVELVPLSPISAGTTQELPAHDHGLVDRVLFEIHPDGGIARLRIFGTPDPQLLSQHMIGVLNSLSPRAAGSRFRSCCASEVWVAGMVEARPFSTIDDVAAASNAMWTKMSSADWEEAFAAHPGIGEWSGRQSYRGEAWSSREQSGVAGSEEEVKNRIAAASAEYERRFGRTYVVFASGRTGSELLEILTRRLDGDPGTELRTAAAEQVKITTLRLRRLLALELG
jgi:allantoicase